MESAPLSRYLFFIPCMVQSSYEIMSQPSSAL
uniref:Uncharacterized protein n=1 Tax=Rhizophora mucronata TaxID=61149 RepID=A0A2P2PMK8_RHIMU